MYGLLGSMIISFMMISVKKCQAELVSVLNSEMAQHIEKALMKMGFAYSRHGVENLKDISINLLGSDGTPEEGNGQANSSNTEYKASQGHVDNKKTLEEELNNVNNIRVLRRLEIRLAEFVKIQEKGMAAEINDFQKQRGEMLRSLAEQTEASNQFRTELQRVGRQLGGILTLMEKGNDEMQTEIRELIIRLTDDAAETHRLLGMIASPPKE